MFRAAGAERVAYTPIVGSGPNATILHYRRNDRRMEDGDLVLVDAGAEYSYYAADVTRTFPVSGKFTRPQRDVYSLVLDAQLAAIDAIRPGATIDGIHQVALRAVTEGLRRLGLIEGSVEQLVTDEAYKPFFPHPTSHWLGMDVHDAGAYYVSGQSRSLEPGMVISRARRLRRAGRHGRPATLLGDRRADRGRRPRDRDRPRGPHARHPEERRRPGSLTHRGPTGLRAPGPLLR